MMGIKFSFTLNDLYFGVTITLRSTLNTIVIITYKHINAGWHFNLWKIHHNASMRILDQTIFLYLHADPVQLPWPLSITCRYLIGMHGYSAKYLLSEQIVAFFTICIGMRLETFLLSVSVSCQQNAYRYSYLKNKLFDI